MNEEINLNNKQYLHYYRGFVALPLIAHTWFEFFRDSPTAMKFRLRTSWDLGHHKKVTLLYILRNSRWVLKNFNSSYSIEHIITECSVYGKLQTEK